MQYISGTLCFNWPSLVEQIRMNFCSRYKLIGGKEEQNKLTLAIRDAIVNLIKIEIEEITSGVQGFNQTNLLRDNVYDALFEYLGVSIRDGDTVYNFVHEMFYDFTDFYYTIKELSKVIEEKGVYTIWRVSVIAERIDILEVGDIRIMQWEALTHKNGEWNSSVYEAARKASQRQIDNIDDEETLNLINDICLEHPMVKSQKCPVKPSFMAEMDILHQLRIKRW